VLADIGAALRDSPSYHVVAVRSTVLPGVVAGRLIPILEQASGRRAGVDFGVCVNPEFLREGSAIKDFERPPFTVIGALDARSADVLAGVYAHLEAPVRRVLPDEASMVKYASNIFHAMKVTFANEIGAMCHELGVDGQAVMGIFCEDRELNISTRYLRPGFAFGGSCLPKDLRAMSYVAKANDISVPLVNSVIPSNDAQIARVADLVLESRKRVTMLGLSFKEGSDDLRESPFVRLAEALIGKGVALRIYDPDVAISDVFGRNRAYLEEHLPHVGRLMGTDITDALSNAELVIVCKRVRGIDQVRALTSDHVTLIDLVGLPQLGDALRPWAAAPDATGATTVPAAH
jgi:GDP-mannose 6-dehydrogenase